VSKALRGVSGPGCFRFFWRFFLVLACGFFSSGTGFGLVFSTVRVARRVWLRGGLRLRGLCGGRLRGGSGVEDVVEPVPRPGGGLRRYTDLGIGADALLDQHLANAGLVSAGA
jgi:hypothetical protein